MARRARHWETCVSHQKSVRAFLGPRCASAIENGSGSGRVRTLPPSYFLQCKNCRPGSARKPLKGVRKGSCTRTWAGTISGFATVELRPPPAIPFFTHKKQNRGSASLGSPFKGGVVVARVCFCIRKNGSGSGRVRVGFRGGGISYASRHPIFCNAKRQNGGSGFAWKPAYSLEYNIICGALRSRRQCMELGRRQPRLVRILWGDGGCYVAAAVCVCVWGGEVCLCVCVWCGARVVRCGMVRRGVAGGI